MTTKQVALTGCIGALVCLAAACGGSVCDRTSALNRSLSDKGKPCEGNDAGVTITTTTFDKVSCEANVQSCTSADLKIINAQIDCAEKIETCQPGNELPWIGSLLSCAKDLNQVTPACLDATTGQ